jgi:integrase
MGKRRAKGDGALWFSETEKVWIGEIVLPDGKAKRKRNKLQKVVRAWLDEQKEAVRENRWVSKDTLKCGEFFDRYLTDIAQATLKPKTIESYTYIVENHLRPAIGELRLVALKPDTLQALYSKKISEGLSKRTVNYINAVLRLMLNIAREWGLVAFNVAEVVKLAPSDKREIKPLTVTQVKRLFEVLEGDRLYCFYVLAALGGFRRGELLGLQISDVNLEDGIVQVRHNLVSVRGKGLILGEPKSDASRRPIVLPEFALNALKNHMANHKGKSEYVFCTGNGTPFSPRNMIRHFKAALNRAGLPPETRIHDLRHAFISWLLAKGTPPKDVQMIAGHSSFSVTMDIYGHLMPGAQKEAAKTIDSLFQ